MISTLIPPQKVKVNSKLKVKVLESEITKVLLAINLLPNILKNLKNLRPSGAKSLASDAPSSSSLRNSPPL